MAVVAVSHPARWNVLAAGASGDQSGGAVGRVGLSLPIPGGAQRSRRRLPPAHSVPWARRCTRPGISPAVRQSRTRIFRTPPRAPLALWRLGLCPGLCRPLRAPMRTAEDAPRPHSSHAGAALPRPSRPVGGSLPARCLRNPSAHAAIPEGGHLQEGGHLSARLLIARPLEATGTLEASASSRKPRITVAQCDREHHRRPPCGVRLELRGPLAGPG